MKFRRLISDALPSRLADFEKYPLESIAIPIFFIILHPERYNEPVS